MILSICVVLALSLFLILKSKNFSWKILISLSLLMVASFIGARLLNVLLKPEIYINNPGNIFELRPSGFVLSGGFLFAIIIGLLINNLLSINLLKIMDIIYPSIGLGIIIWRIGCFLNGCCFGSETTLPWGVIYPKFSEAYNFQVEKYGALLSQTKPVHPTQIYEIIVVIISFLLSFFISKKVKYEGIPAMYFFIIFFFFHLLNTLLFYAKDLNNLSNIIYIIINIIVIIMFFLIMVIKMLVIKKIK
jgi:phosphatidylglycerol:prolipoprotein diacylglycerol transferase